MNINLTLLVQIINFVIAYFILTRGLLRPVLALIKKELAQKRSLEAKLSSEQKIVEAKQQTKINNLEEAKAYFSSLEIKPELNHIETNINSKNIAVSIDDQELKDIVDKATVEIKERIING